MTTLPWQDVPADNEYSLQLPQFWNRVRVVVVKKNEVVEPVEERPKIFLKQSVDKLWERAAVLWVRIAETKNEPEQSTTLSLDIQLHFKGSRW